MFYIEVCCKIVEKFINNKVYAKGKKNSTPTISNSFNVKLNPFYFVKQGEKRKADDDFETPVSKRLRE